MEAINIILDERSGPDIYFVEIETDEGYSIGIGKRVPYENGLTKLRITIEDIAQVDLTELKAEIAKLTRIAQDDAEVIGGDKG